MTILKLSKWIRKYRREILLYCFTFILEKSVSLCSKDNWKSGHSRDNMTKENTIQSLNTMEIPQDQLNKLTAECRKTSYGGSGDEEKYGATENCLNSPYRTASGVCNNPQHFSWGASQEPFLRLLLPDYEDGWFLFVW